MNVYAHAHAHIYTESVLHWPTTPGYGACPDVWLIYIVVLH